MTTIEPTTTTTRSEDGLTYVETTWVCGNYTLSRQSLDGFHVWGVKVNNRSLPTLYGGLKFDGETAEYGVNWSSLGPQPAGYTRIVAERLHQAADAAEAFTAIHNEQER